MTRGGYVEAMQRMMRLCVHGGDDDCWNWTGCKNRQGYGIFSLRGKRMNASRASYIIFIGDVPPKMCVCHSCDNPSCVNPSHLWVGSYKDNWADCRSKGRETKGAVNGKSKLTDADVAAIRIAVKNGDTQQSIATRFGVTHGTVSKIAARKLWPHVIP